MKTTIASLALLASATSAQALIGPGVPNNLPKPKTYCLETYEGNDGSLYLGTCDRSEINKRLNLPLNENKCADGQAAFTSVTVKIKACPTFVQL